MTAPRILIIEDDPALSDVLAYNLQEAGYEIHVEHDGQKGLDHARSTPPELIVLDLMLPSLNGIEVCRQLRSNQATRHSIVLMLTAKAEETDQVVGFAVGADDYVTKPFSVKVLCQRVRALLRRRDAAGQPGDVAISQGIVIDRQSHVATAGEQRLPLTPSEFMLLDMLIRHPGRAYTRADLIDVVQGGDSIVLERTIDVHIRSLRQKLGAYAELIETVRGVGYRFRDPLSVI